jgi:hypothetical protein
VEALDRLKRVVRLKIYSPKEGRSQKYYPVLIQKRPFFFAPCGCEELETDPVPRIYLWMGTSKLSTPVIFSLLFVKA